MTDRGSPKYTLEYCKGKKVPIKCSTKEETSAVTKLLTSNGYSWANGRTDWDPWEYADGRTVWIVANSDKVLKNSTKEYWPNDTISASQFLIDNIAVTDDIQIGSIVKCKPGYKRMTSEEQYKGGSGYEEDKIIKVARIDKYDGPNDVLWDKTGDGIHRRAVTLVTDTQIGQDTGRKWKIGDQFQSEGSTTLYTIEELLTNSVYIKWNGGRTTYLVDKVDEFWGKLWTPYQPANIPVTVDNAVIGMRVIRGRDWKYGDQDNNGEGKIIEAQGYFPLADYKWVKVKWNNKTFQYYSIGDEDKYHLSVAPSNTVIKQSNNNNQSQIKTNNNATYKENNNSNPDSQYTGTAVNISANTSTICRADRRTAVTVRQSGQSIEVITGHRSNSKGLRLS